MRERQLLGLVAQIYDAALEPKRWVDFATAFERAVGGGAVAMCLPHPGAGTGGGGFIVAPSCDPAFVERYRTQYQTNPFVPFGEKLPAGRFQLGERCVPRAELEHSAFYADWMAPQGFHAGPLLGGVIDRDAQRGIDAIVVFRRRGDRHYGAEQERLGQLLMPHLQRALRLSRRAADLSGERKVLSAALDCVPVGLVLLDQYGHVVAANQPAERLLARRDGLVVDRDGVHAALPADDAELRRLVAEASHGTGLAGSLRLGRPSARRPLEVLVTALRTSTDEFGTKRPTAALFVTDPEEGIEDSQSLLGRLYGLTPAETALACALASGLSLNDAAEELKVTRETIRSRLKHVFFKMGTTRQAELVRLLLGGVIRLEVDPTDEPAFGQLDDGGLESKSS